MAEIELRGVSLVYPDGTEALAHIDLQVSDGELMSILGPSGCGKTSVLRLVAGLERPTSGEVIIDGAVVNDRAAKDRGVGMVFQGDALYRHLTARGNIAFPLKMRRLKADEVDRRVVEEAGELGIVGMLDMLPGQLSAGHRQSVAAGRALVKDARIYLMDEPLAMLDAASRVRVRSEIARMQDRLGATMIYVTNDQSEAMALGDRVAVMRVGAIEQIDTPERIYNAPASLYVAQFVGAPGMNVVLAEVRMIDGELELAMGGDEIRLDAALTARLPEVRARAGRDVVVGIRPEHAGPAGPGEPFERCLHVTAFAVEQLGDYRLIHSAFGAPPGGSVDFVARFPADHRTVPGDRVELAIRRDRLVFFDPADGRAI